MTRHAGRGDDRRIRMRSLLILLLVSGLVSGSTGCATPGKFSRKKEPAPARPQPPRVIGTVALVNNDQKFVLVDIGSTTTPEQGLALQVMRNGEQAATLTTGAESKRPFILADIVSGAPEKGDTVTAAGPAATAEGGDSEPQSIP